MDGKQFDHLIRSGVADRASRRRVVRGLLGAVLASVAAPRSGNRAAAEAAAEAAAKRCLDEGKACKRDTQCCSGVCRGTKCRRVPGQHTCTIRRDLCRDDITLADSICDAAPGLICVCVRCLNGAAFCADFREGLPCDEACASDAVCIGRFGPGAACVRAGGCCGEDATACVPPCPSPA